MSPGCPNTPFITFYHTPPVQASAEGDDALVIPPELNEGLEGLDGPAGDLPTDALALEGIDLSGDLTVDGLLFEGSTASKTY